MNAKQLDELIKQMDETAQVFHRCLQEETSALAASDSDSLNTITRQKQDLAQTLEAQEQNRVALLAAAHMPTEAQQLLSLLQAQGLQNTAGRWQTMLENLQACKALNEKNGEIIQQRCKQLNQTINLLFSPPEKNVYSGEPLEKPLFSGQLLGSA